MAAYGSREQTWLVELRTEASVRSIASSPGIGMGCGFMAAEHAVSLNAVVMEPKVCENCGRVFFRKRHDAAMRQVLVGGDESLGLEPSVAVKDTGDRFCGKCKASCLLPPDDAEYREELRLGSEEGHWRHQLPHYDDSLVKRKLGGRHSSVAQSDWRHKLMLVRDPLTFSRMAEITGHANAESVRRCLKYWKIEVTAVASEWPRKSKYGRESTKLYRLSFPCSPRPN